MRKKGTTRIVEIIFLLVQGKYNHFEIFFMDHKFTHIAYSSPLIPSTTLVILLENAYIERSKTNVTVRTMLINRREHFLCV